MGVGHDTRDAEAVPEATFGVMPQLEVPPRTEWDRGYG